MTLDTALAYIGSISARLDALDDALREQRRQAIRGTIYLLITDPFDREDAIQGAHDAGLMCSPLETLHADLLAAVEPWLPKKEANNA